MPLAFFLIIEMLCLTWQPAHPTIPSLLTD